MFHNTFVMSQKEAIKWSEQQHNYPSVIISINNSFEMDIKFKKTVYNKIADVLTLSFDDVFKSELIQDEKYPHIWLDRYGRAVSPINQKDCEKIHDFVIKYFKSTDYYDLIVHCEMGISRSAGVMGAILKALFNDDTPIFNNRKYRPNPDVYREVLNIFMKNSYVDNINVDNLNNLRFGLEKTPYKYNPIFNPYLGNHSIFYTPSVELCRIMPELENVQECVTVIGTGMPFFKFTFASMLRNDEEQKAIFSGYFNIDDNMYDHREDATNYKDSISYQLMELHDIRFLPDVSTTQTTETVNGVTYEATYYHILLRNQSSPYFYQKTPSSFELEENHNTILEIEYSFPEGLKTWGYFPIKKEELDKANEDYIDIYNKAFSVAYENIEAIISNVANPPIHLNEQNEVVNFYDFDLSIQYNKNFDSTHDNSIYVTVLAEKINGETAIIEFTYNEWYKFYLPQTITSIRVVNF